MEEYHFSVVWLKRGLIHLVRKVENYILIAITGAIGCGKTTVANILKEDGFTVFDSDKFSKTLLMEDGPVSGVLEKLIGQNILVEEKIDFRKVGKFFDDHPRLEEEFEVWYQRFLGKKILDQMAGIVSNKPIVFFDIPLLEQKGISQMFDYVWIIESNEEAVINRIIDRNNYTGEKIKYLIQSSRIDKSQTSYEFKCIENNVSEEELKCLIKNEVDNIMKLIVECEQFL